MRDAHHLRLGLPQALKDRYTIAMYALIRRISPYSGTDPLFLGIFAEMTKADLARQRYLAAMTRDDSWQEQAYKKPNLTSDVQIIEVSDRRSDTARGAGWLVTSVFEGLGQSTRRFEAIFSDHASAKTFASSMEEGPAETAPNWCDVDEVVFNAER